MMVKDSNSELVFTDSEKPGSYCPPNYQEIDANVKEKLLTGKGNGDVNGK